MLKEWKLQNFRSIKTLTDFELSPVTVLAGANSSGKTTLLQSILLVAQTLSSPVAPRTLILNGEAVKLGTWPDIPHYELRNQPVTFECSIELPEQERQDYDVHAEIWPRRLTTWRRHLMEGVTNVTLAASFCGPQRKGQDVSEPSIEKVEIVIRRFEARQRAKDVMPLSSSISVRRRKKALSTKKRQELEPLLPTGITLADLSYIVTQTMPPVPVEPWEDWEYLEEQLVSVKTVGATFRHFLPSSLVQRYDATARQLRRGVRSLLSSLPTRVRRRATNDFLRFIKETISKGAERIPQEVVTSVNDLLRDLRISHQFEGSTWTEFAKFLAAIPTERRVRQRASDLSILLGYELDELVPQDSRRFAIEVVPIPQFARAAILTLHDFFSQRIKYLGPLRDLP